MEGLYLERPVPALARLDEWLATSDAPETGKTYFVQGGTVRYFQPWTMTETIEKDDRWTVDELVKEMPKLNPETSGQG